ncbi:MAG: hypothetical protein ABI373_11110 [Flavobacteriales bacterium]
MKNLHSFRRVLSAMILVLVGIASNAQEMKLDLCKQFNEAKDLYVLDNQADRLELTTTAGNVISFEKLVRQDWPDKNVILMDEKEFKDLDDVKHQFFITLAQFNVEMDRGFLTSTSSLSIVLLQQGKPGRNPKQTLVATYLKMNEIGAGIMPERLAYAVASVKDQTSEPESGVRTTYNYRAADFQDQLDNNTVYIRKSDLSTRVPDEATVAAVYHHPFKLVSDEEWAAAISGAQPDIVYVEFIPGGDYAAIDVRNASTGKLVETSYPWIIRGQKAMEATFLKKLLN